MSHPLSESAHSNRPVFLVVIIGVAIVITLMLGVTVLQAQSNVSEVTLSSTTSSLTSSSHSSLSSILQSSSETLSNSYSSSASTSSVYYGPTGVLGVSLTDPPIVPPGVTNVYISYSSIQVHVGDAGNENGWYQVADSGTVDLMSLVNVSLTLGSAEVQTGVFNLISFNITSADVTINGNNVTAYVPANRINVPIVGGISVSEGNSSGVLVDLSPEVVPYENGTSVSYVLVPEARSLPIPSNVWNAGLEVKGAKLQEVQNQTWASNTASRVVVTGVSITPNSFSLTLQNQGIQNASFSSIVIGQVMSLPECYATLNGAPRPAFGNFSSTVSIMSQYHTYFGNETVYLSGMVNPPRFAFNATTSIVVSDPNGKVVESINAPVQRTGVFYWSFVAGGSVTPWVSGTYNVTADYNGTQGVSSFYWQPAVFSTTTRSDPSSNYTTTTSDSYYSDSTVTTSTVTANITGSTINTTTTTSVTLNSTQIPPAPPQANITVMTNSSSYTGNEGVLVNGTVTPPPITPNFFVKVGVIGPRSTVVFDGSTQVRVNGTFSVALQAGGSDWANGTYTVYAYHQGLVSTTTFQWSGESTVSTSTSNSTVSSTSGSSITNSTDPVQIQNSFCNLYDNGDPSVLPPALSIAYYAILSNGTLYPVNYTSVILFTNSRHQMQHNAWNNYSSTTSLMKDPLTFTLAPGQSMTFTYNGTIDSLTEDLLSYMPRNFTASASLFQINLGQEYTVMASGPFGMRVATVVNATSSP